MYMQVKIGRPHLRNVVHVGTSRMSLSQRFSMSNAKRRGSDLPINIATGGMRCCSDTHTGSESLRIEIELAELPFLRIDRGLRRNASDDKASSSLPL